MRRRLLIGGAVLGGLLLVGLFGAWLFYGRIGAWVVKEKVIPRLENRIGRDIRFGDIDVERGRVVLTDVEVEGAEDDLSPLVEIDQVIATFDYGASWWGEVIVHQVTVEGMTARPRRRVDGTDNFREILGRLEGKPREPGAKASKSGVGRLRPRSLRLIGSRVVFQDERTGASVTAEAVSAVADRSDQAVLTVGRLEFLAEHGPSAALGDIIVTVDLSDPMGSARADIGNGKVKMWKGMSLTGIKGDVQQGDTPGQLVVDLTGSYGGSTETLWHADGWLEPESRRGKLAVAAERFTLNRIAKVLEKSMVKDFDDTSIDAEMLIEIDDGKADIAGRLDVSGLNVEHKMLSEQMVSDISFKGKLAASFDSKARTLDLASMSLVSRGVDYQLSGSVALRGGFETDGTRREFSRLAAHAVVPKAHCQAVLESIPGAIVPKLQGFELNGPFEADVVLEIDWSNLEELTVLDGYVGLPKCKIVAPNEEFDATRLRGSFDHEILVGPEEYETVDIGMESPNYAQIFDISPYFLNAVMTQEDSRFYDHRGFIPREFRSALIRNLQAGRFKFGASSITMQMVKNVFLYRDKTMSRKLQELFLTWYVEQSLDKNRILEIYVNAIEYGPGVYGIVRAAQAYFDKHPRDLSPVEAAWLTQLLPRPRLRYFQYCKNKLNRRTSNKVGRILKNMNKRGRLTADELLEATVEDIEFNSKKVKELCNKPPDW